MNRYLIIAILLCVCLGIGASIATEFEMKLRSVQSDGEALQLIRSYVLKTNDFDDLRYIQNSWLNVDPAGCEAYFADLYGKNRNSDKFHYLFARSIRDPHLALTEARKMTSSYPDSEWGYRLVNSAYNRFLFNEETALPAFANSINTDRALIVKAFTLFPTEQYMLYTMVNLHRYEENYSEMEALILNANAEMLDFMSVTMAMDFCVESGSTRIFEKHSDMLLDQLQRSKAIAAEERDKVYGTILLMIWQKLNQWENVEAYFAKNPAELDNRDRYMDLIALNMARSNHDRALDYIATLMREGRINYKYIEANKDWQVMAASEKYRRLVYEAKLKWESEIPLRRQKALAEDIKIPAPDWSLPDASGKIVKLSEQKGNVVILDFWATWCSPCKQVMPMIDNWMRKGMPTGVKVYSINIWEREPAKAIEFMDKNKYSMKLLMGNNEVAEEYFIEGIPYICVIDPAGNLRFIESGYEPELEERLSFWTEFLQSEGKK